MRCTALYHSQSRAEPNQFCEPVLTPSCLLSRWAWFVLYCCPEWMAFYRAVMSTIEMRWSHLRGCLGNTCSLPKMYNRKLPSLHRRPPTHAAPPPGPRLLWLRAFFLPEEVDLLLLELPRPLKGTLSINRGCSSLNEARGSTAKRKTRSSTSSRMLPRSLSQYGKKCIQFGLTNRAEVCLSVSFW